MERVKKDWDIKLTTTEKRRNYLASRPNYYSAKSFSENVLPIEMKKKTQIFINKPFHQY